MPIRRKPGELRDLVPEWNTETLADVWKAERERRGWSQEDVAEKVGMSRGNVSKLESGPVTPTYLDAALLASVYEINIADLTRRVGLPVARGEAAPDYAAMEDERLAAAVRLLLASKDAEWRRTTIGRLFASVLEHEGRGADD